MDLMFPEESQLNHVLDVLAYHAKNPGKKIQHALLIRGGQGTGKNTLFEKVMRKIVGDSNFRMVAGDAMLSRFTNELVATQMLLINEVMLTEGHEAYNRLKEIITEEVVMAEEKGRSRAKYMTPRLTIILSNDETPLPLDSDDRRFFVPDFIERSESGKFFEDLNEVLDQEIPAFYAMLRTRDLSNFKASRSAPDTAQKRAMQAEVRPPVERQIKRWLEEHVGSFAKDVIIPSKVVIELQLAGLQNASEQNLRRALRKIGAKSHVQLPVSTKWEGRPRCYIVRNHAAWLEQTPCDLAQYLTQLSSKHLHLFNAS
jgi:hypothetical protein